MKMQEEIFRKKSIDKMKSPENLDEYIRVSNPGVWLLLVGIVVLLIGALIWATFGNIDSVLNATVQVNDGKAVCYVNENSISLVKTGLTVRFEDEETTITEMGDKSDLGYTCTLADSFSLADGYYEAQVVLESYKPISFVLN